MPSIPIENQLREAWHQFRTYAKDHMGYTNKQNLNESLNGAGAFVDFLCGKRPKMGTSYATTEEDNWPT